MKRILIVDDAATVRLFHRNIIESAGFAADEAINGIEALEKALSMPYDLFLVDINMPKLDGYGFIKELRSQDIAQAPAMIVSTEAKESDRDKAYLAGANLYIIKPTKPQELLTYISLLLGEEAV